MFFLLTIHEFESMRRDFIVFVPRLSSLSFGSYVNLAVVTQAENKASNKIINRI